MAQQMTISARSSVGLNCKLMRRAELLLNRTSGVTNNCGKQ